MEKEAQPTKGAGETVRSVTDQADVKESTLPEQQEVTSTADIEKKYTDSIKEKTFLGFHYHNFYFVAIFPLKMCVFSEDIVFIRIHLGCLLVQSTRCPCLS